MTVLSRLTDGMNNVRKALFLEKSRSEAVVNMHVPTARTRKLCLVIVIAINFSPIVCYILCPVS